MNRRSFTQALGSAAVLSALPKTVSCAESSETTRPGTILAVSAHPGDGLFTMGAVLAQHTHRGGAGILLNLSLGERGAPKQIAVPEYGEMQRVATDKAAGLLGFKATYLP